MNDISSSDLILLTGAGFTKNFGGFLGSEMWSLIYNNPLMARSPELKRRLTHNHDYESIYSEVLDDESFTTEEKETIQTVVEEAYRALDDSVKNWRFTETSPYPVNWYGLNNLLSLFSGDNTHQGFFFTLNQDIFMERRSGSVCPGVPRFSHEFYNIGGRNLQENDFVVLPNEDNVVNDVRQGIQNHNGQVYIKLHGSYGWRSALGTSPMVIGKNKTALIESEPILREYFDLFKNVLSGGNKKLLIIGYGFMDKHINEVIWDAAKNNGLQIYIISPTPSGEFEPGNFILDGHRLWDSIAGYFPHRLVEIFPGNQEVTTLFTQIRNSLLRN